MAKTKKRSTSRKAPGQDDHPPRRASRSAAAASEDERRLHVDWDDRVGPPARRLTKELASDEAKARRSSRLPPPDKVNKGIRILQLLEHDIEKHGKYYTHWDTFVARTDHVLSRQSLRELHYARLVLGESLLRDALLSHGHAKTVHLSRIPGLKKGKAKRILQSGLDIHDNEQRRPLNEMLDADLRAYVRRKQAQLGVEGRIKLHARRSWRRGKKERDYAKRAFIWPAALLTDVRALALAWPRMNVDGDPDAVPRISAARRVKREARLPKQVRRAQDARTTLLEAAAKLDRWLVTKDHEGTSQDLLRGPLDVLDAAWNRFSSERNAAGTVSSKLTPAEGSYLASAEVVLKEVLAAVRRRRRAGTSGRSSDRRRRPSP